MVRRPDGLELNRLSYCRDTRICRREGDGNQVLVAATPNEKDCGKQNAEKWDSEATRGRFHI